MKQSKTSCPAKPRLLMLTHRFPFPPNRGDRIRAYHLLRFLADKFSVTLAAVSDEPIADDHLQHVQSLCETVLVERLDTGSKIRGAVRSVLRSSSLTEGMLSSRRLAASVVGCHQENLFDAVVVFCSGMFPYVDVPAFRDVQMLVDLVDVDSQKWQQMSHDASLLKRGVYSRESRHVRQLEQRIADRANAVTLVSDEESRLYQHTVSVPVKTVVQGVSNGVDADYFSPDATIRQLDQQLGSDLSLVFTGVMNYYPNVAGVAWFCQQVLPLVRDRFNVTFKIVGRSPNAKVRSLARLDGVEVVGEVPDVRPYLRAADVVVSPLKLARGIQNKVLEAMAMQRPVICTTPSAEGIAGDHGTHFLIADTVDQWCNELTRLHEDLNLRTRIAAAARLQVIQRYSWPARLHPILNLLQLPTAEPVNV